MADKIKLVMFDLAGTTLDDSVEGVPLVTVAMRDAFKKHGYNIHPETVNKYRDTSSKIPSPFINLGSIPLRPLSGQN